MAADEQNDFEQEALEEAAAAAKEEKPEREIHPDSPELVTPDALAAAEGAEETEEPAEEVAAEEPAEGRPEEPQPVAQPEMTQPPPQHQMPGFVPVAALQAERQRAQAAMSRVDELSAGLEAIKQHFEQEQAAKRAAEAQSSIPQWDQDPIGHLRTVISQSVVGDITPRLEKLEGVLGKLDGLVGQTEEQMKAREAESTLRQAYTMQEQAAMSSDPYAASAIRYFHQQRYNFHRQQGYDENTAGHMANEDRFRLYTGGGAQNGPLALVTMYRNLGVDPVQAWQAVEQSFAAAQQETAEPSMETKVPAKAAKGPQRVPPGPRRLQRVDEIPPPVRRRRPSEDESTAYNYLMHHYDEIPPNEVDNHIRKYAQEADIPLKTAYSNILEARRARLSA